MLASVGLAAFYVDFWFLGLVSAGLAVFYVILCCFGLLESICANRTQAPVKLDMI